MEQPIETREVRGISAKTIIGVGAPVIAIVAAAAIAWTGIKNEIQLNRDLLQEIKADNRADKQVNQMRMKEIEANQKLTDIRLTILETELKSKNP